MIINGFNDGLLHIPVFDADLRAPGLTRSLIRLPKDLQHMFATRNANANVSLAFFELASPTVITGQALASADVHADAVARASFGTTVRGG